MTKEEIIKQDLGTSLNLLGDRVMIQLNEIQEHTQTEAGLWIPSNELTETDGGKITTRPSKTRYYAKGKVLNVSKQAKSKLEEQGYDIQLGDEVYVAKNCLTSDAFHFYIDRSKPVQDFKGLICIPHNLIEAK